jgi:hypothetical protein
LVAATKAHDEACATADAATAGAERAKADADAALAELRQHAAEFEAKRVSTEAALAAGMDAAAERDADLDARAHRPMTIKPAFPAVVHVGAADLGLMTLSGVLYIAAFFRAHRIGLGTAETQAGASARARVVQ